MERKKVIYMIFSLILLLAASTAAVFAWLVDYKYTNTITLKSGKVEYQLNGSLTSGLVVPGQNLVTSQYQLINKSTVDSQLRIQFTIVIKDDVTNNDLYTFDITDPRVLVSFGLGTDFVKETDGFYYYGGMANGVLLSTNTTPITIVSSIVLNGSHIHNDYANNRVLINVLIQAKQLGYDWQTLLNESVDFQTGIGN